MGKRRGHGEGTIHRRKDGRWQGAITVGRTVDGRQKRRTVYGKTQAEVREKLDEIKRQLNAGIYTDNRITLEDYLDLWLANKALEVKPRTLEFYSFYTRKYINPKLGWAQLAKITTAQVRSFMRDVASEVSPDAANKARTVLNAALRQVVRDAVPPRNPAEVVSPFKTSSSRKSDAEWTRSEAVAFLNTARTHRLFATFYLAMSTGLRHGEVLGLRWQDIEEGSVVVRQNLIRLRGGFAISTPKTGAGTRRVTLDPETEAVLASHKQLQAAEAARAAEAWGPPAQEFQDLVFTTELGGPISPSELRPRLVHPPGAQRGSAGYASTT